MIYPNKFPENKEHEKAEKTVYEKLRLLSNDYDIYYSKRFVNTTKYRKSEFEIDFIISKPEHGILCLEVKGGLINYNGTEDNWTQNSRLMQKDPVKQATSSMHSFVNIFTSLTRNIPVGWALCFPDCELIDAETPKSVNNRQILDQKKLLFVENSIDDLFSFIKEQNHHRSGSNQSDYEKLKKELLRDMGFVQLISTKIQSDEQKFIELTNEQITFFDRIKSNRHILTIGPAGSGKTIIAKTLAEDLNSQGKNVLFLCFNRTLANSIRNSFPLDHALNKTNGLNHIGVLTFHSLAKNLITDNDPNWWSENSKKYNFWDQLITQKLINILPKINSIYDAIIVDEAQDFKPIWIDIIFRLINKNNLFYIFLDRNQNIYGNEINFEVPFFKYYLTENCRNTKQIINTINKIPDIEVLANNNSPNGEPVITKNFKSKDDEFEFLQDEISNLINNQKIYPKQIIILLYPNKRSSCLDYKDTIANLNLIQFDRKEWEKNLDDILIELTIDDIQKISYTTINSYKGLESDVVFIIDLQNLKTVQDDKSKFLIYTGLSRAKHKLYLLSANS